MMPSMDENVETPRALKRYYRYIRLLGEGSYGKTWLARDTYNDNDVAIKEIKYLADLKMLDLIKREADVLKSVKIPGVPRLYESIMPKFGSETCFLVQEFIDAPTLESHLKDGVIFQEPECIEILKALAQILFSLQTQYAPPIIHRDIKPSNILIKRNSNNMLQLYLIDFGAVANPQKPSGGSTIAGTFGYMAPEQMRGEILIQSDFYSLGATAVHLLTGVPPYDIPHHLFELQFHELLQEKNPSVSSYMLELLDKLLAPDITKRPANANELILDIQAVEQQKRRDIIQSKKMAPGMSALKNLFNILLKKDISPDENESYYASNKINTKPDSTWLKADGWIRTITHLETEEGPVNAFEYTFTADNHCWCGAWAMSNKNISHDLGMPSSSLFENPEVLCIEEPWQFPIKCTVLYNPKLPRINKLIYEKIVLYREATKLSKRLNGILDTTSFSKTNLF